MIRKFFHNLLLRRHFWRYVTLSEVSEIYASRVLRMAAFHVMGSFVAIYLYQQGYSIAIIGLIWAIFYFFRALIALPATRLIAWIGPKHATFVSNILYIPVMVSFALFTDYGLWVIIPTFALQGLSTTIYVTAHAINFSKVKSVQHAGKEIAYMNIFEKITTGVSPIIGGGIAFIWGPEITMVVAAVLFAFAAAPLMITGEQIRTRQRLVFRGFPWRLLFRQAWGQMAIGFDLFASGTVWSLYIAVVILGIGAGDNDVYAVIGILTSVVLVVAIIASYTYGKIIDRRRGRELLRAGVIGSAVTHALRPFVMSPVVVAGVNAGHELSAAAYSLPYTRALYDNADISGARVTYVGLTEVLSNIGGGLGALVITFVAAVSTGELAMKSLFFVAAGVVLLILTSRFPLFRK